MSAITEGVCQYALDVKNAGADANVDDIPTGRRNLDECFTPAGLDNELSAILKPSGLP